MMLRYSLNQSQLADRIEQVAYAVLDQGLRTRDIADGGSYVSTQEMGGAVVTALNS